MGCPNVDAMLAGMTSQMLTEWIAYEKFAGPIGSEYLDMVSRVTLDQVRNLNYLTGAQFKENPYPRPTSDFPTPVEYVNPEPEPEVDEELEALRKEDEIMRFDAAMTAITPPPPEPPAEEEVGDGDSNKPGI